MTSRFGSTLPDRVSPRGVNTREASTMHHINSVTVKVFREDTPQDIVDRAAAIFCSENRGADKDLLMAVIDAGRVLPGSLAKLGGWVTNLVHGVHPQSVKNVEVSTVTVRFIEER
jgi:hypothetical protein